MLSNRGSATDAYVDLACLLQLRDRMQRALGEAFRLIDFHDLVLQAGPVPMLFLNRIVEGYLAGTETP